MIWLLLIIIFLVIVLSLSLFLPLVCQLSIYLTHEIEIEISVKLAKIQVYSKTIEYSLEAVIDEIIPKLFNKELLKSSIQYNRLKLNQLTWYSTIGLEDAAITTLSASGLWLIKGMACQYIFSLMNQPTDYQYQVKPSFDQFVIQSECECIISTPLWQAIYMKYKRQ